jgi:hypothetical protein
MIRIHHVFAALVVVAGLAFVADSVVAKGKHHHQDGKKLLGEKVKKDGKHTLDKKGDYEASIDVVKGKVAGVKVKHAKKGDVPVKKYKTSKKMVEAGNIQRVAFTLAQAQYLGTTWIGYAYVDDYGDEVIYWFPYDMIYDGDTGAIEYVPVY